MNKETGINLDKDLMQKLKIYCVRRGITMKDFVEKLIKENIKK